MTDIFNYYTQWLITYPTSLYNSFIRDVVVIDPLKTVQDYLVDLVNDNSIIIEKMSHIQHLLQENNNILIQINYLLWWLVLIVFIAFCGWILKTLIYGIMSALKI